MDTKAQDLAKHAIITTSSCPSGEVSWWCCSEHPTSAEHLEQQLEWHQSSCTQITIRGHCKTCCANQDYAMAVLEAFMCMRISAAQTHSLLTSCCHLQVFPVLVLSHTHFCLQQRYIDDFSFKSTKEFSAYLLVVLRWLIVAIKKTVTETGLCILFAIVIFGKKLHQLQWDLKKEKVLMFEHLKLSSTRLTRKLHVM